jgi:release factor glutamine methyltransferase
VSIEEPRLLGDSTIRTDSEILRKILKTIIPTASEVYSPSDDSILMLDAISNIPLEGKEVLDIGTGSGILALFCALHGAKVIATDVDKSALTSAHKAARSLGVDLKVALSNLFSNVSERFDLVLFNPPYVPSSTIEDKTIDGGKKGVQLTVKFLDTVAEHLKIGGSALLLVSSRNDPGALMTEHPELDFSVVAKRALFFEELQVLRLSLRNKLTR